LFVTEKKKVIQMVENSNSLYPSDAEMVCLPAIDMTDNEENIVRQVH